MHAMKSFERINKGLKRLLETEWDGLKRDRSTVKVAEGETIDQF
jgi:hypothetical protein